ncbi:MAG: peptide chain release factor N(5)-glutamine methyltransferase [Crocinitomicaceae bacterium]|nr:peptide chain release factor N(5)-glutamine methyltransferase [Crocinitomicaceae bacterium]MDG1659481.1 peptide chain release factor N(5)-glutamine methyltransferase [Crocinitomicaceae bacterium]
MSNTFLIERLGLSKTEIMLGGEVEVPPSDFKYFGDVIDRLIKDEPFQYIAGTTEFYGLELKCDSRALIPRPETEELVQWMIDSIPCESVLRIGDICSGSGCIGLALKSKLKMCIIDSYELSDEALSLIADNIKHTGLNLNVEKFDALSTDFSSIQKNYSALVSNPPYIPFKDGSDMHENVLAHEPHMALFVEDDDPLVFYDNICLNGKAVLIDGGWIYFEIHEDLAAQVKSIFEGNGFVNIEVRKDLQGKERMVRGQKLPSHHEQE